MCDYYDDVEQLKGFGSANKESLSELVWVFFEHWAWKHDYNNAVVSVRTGGFLTKSQKEWTRRVGNERHLVCIEVCSEFWAHATGSVTCGVQCSISTCGQSGLCSVWLALTERAKHDKQMSGIGNVYHLHCRRGISIRFISARGHL